MDLAIEEKLRAVTTSAGNPNAFTSKLKDGGVYVMHVLPTVEFAKIAEKAGVDAVVAEGVEALREEMRGEFKIVRAETAREFEETRSLIRLSYSVG